MAGRFIEAPSRPIVSYTPENVPIDFAREPIGGSYDHTTERWRVLGIEPLQVLKHRPLFERASCLPAVASLIIRYKTRHYRLLGGSTDDHREAASQESFHSGAIFAAP